MRVGFVTLITGALISLWYATGVAFSVGIKHCPHDDLGRLTSIQLTAGVCILSARLTFSAGRKQFLHAAAAAPRRELLASGVLFLCGTVFTNASLVLLSVGFAHTLKACEPIVTVVLLGITGQRTSAMSLLAVACIVCGVLVTASTQGSLSTVGVVCGLASNVCLQARNLVNQRLMDGGPRSLSPDHLLTLSFMLASAIELPAHALMTAVDQHSNSHPAMVIDELTSGALVAGFMVPSSWRWYALTGGAFVAYQLCSIHVLARVHVLLHAVINTLRRAVIIGISAVLLHERVSDNYMAGVTLALAGVLTLSISKHVRSNRGSAAMCVGLLLLLGRAGHVDDHLLQIAGVTRASDAQHERSPHASGAHRAQGGLTKRSRVRRQGNASIDGSTAHGARAELTPRPAVNARLLNGTRSSPNRAGGAPGVEKVRPHHNLNQPQGGPRAAFRGRPFAMVQHNRSTNHRPESA